MGIDVEVAADSPFVFVSYKSEDRHDVHRIVEGLRKEGIEAWWDQDLTPGGRWRGEIARVLAEAGCVVVVWSRRSVQPDHGDFVHDEARVAKQRGVFLPVRIAHVEPPLGFGAHQAHDLIGWSGRRSDRAWRGLSAAVLATLANEPAPAPVPVPVPRRWVARSVALGLMTLFIGLPGLLAVYFVSQPCQLTTLQPLCRTVGLGPSEEEAALWQSRTVGDCAVLERYLAIYPEGTHAQEARHRISTALRRDTGETRSRSLHYPLLETTAAATPEAAKSAMQSRLQREAERTCRGFQPQGLVGTTVDVHQRTCERRVGKVHCQAEADAVCEIAEPIEKPWCP